MPSLVIDDFSGGLNLRDSPNQLQLNESPTALNFTLDERGDLTLRNGCLSAAALPGVAGKTAYIFYSETLDQWLCARETSGAPNTLKLFTRPGDLSGSWTDRGTINSDVTASAAFIDFPGATPKVVFTSSVLSGGGGSGGVFTWDGTTLANPTSKRGQAICLWQNKAWVAGYPTSDVNGNPTSLFWCDAGDPATWSATNIQQIREKDASPLTALGVAGGALIVFKKRSAYRVSDSSTGAYSTIDSAAGCVNGRAVVPLKGHLFVWGADGMYECDGVGRLRNVGDKIRPFYLSSGTTPSTICGGVYQDKVVFCGTVDGSSMFFEYHPTQGWIVRHNVAGSTRAFSFTSKDGALYAAVTGDALYRMFTETPGGGAEGLFVGIWWTPWLLPNSGMLSRLHRCRIQGRIKEGTTTTLDLAIDRNWGLGPADSYAIGDSLRASSAAIAQVAVDLQSLGHANSFALNFSTGTAAGAVSIRAIQLIDQSLQWPSPGYPRRPGTAGARAPVPSGNPPGSGT